MVTNTIHGLQDGDWNASFLLNAQGRILGDANIYRTPDALVLQTSRSQIDRLTAHLDHFIIMDDVELRPLAAPRATIGVAGPKAPQVLAALGLHIPESGAFESATVNSVSVTIVHAHSPVVPRFEIWIPAENLADLWPTLQASAVPCGISAAEALRILQATPLYGVDIQERHLAQETGQTRMLNFNKGCYLGQEIVERVRSRATVHRNLHQFSVQNTPDSLEPGQTIEVSADGAERNPVGELTSLAHYSLPSFTGALALGVIRTEAVERKLPLTHSGGALSVLDTPPSLS
jgi:folate-binding protein YgfZ